MRGFVYRDLCMVKHHWKTIGILIVIFAVMMFVRDTSYQFQTILPIYLILTFSNQAVNEDEKSGWARFAAAVPDGRRGMVRSKYVVVLLAAAVVLCMELLAAIVLAVMGKQELVFSIQIALVSIGLSVLVAEISLPMMYTFGYRDGAFLSIIMMVLLLFVTGGAAYKGMQACDWDLRGLNILILVPLAAALFLRASYRASLSMVRRRDF